MGYYDLYGSDAWNREEWEDSDEVEVDYLNPNNDEDPDE